MSGGIAGEKVVVVDVPGEGHFCGREPFSVGEGLERVEVRALARELADQQEPDVGRDEALPIRDQPDQVFLALAEGREIDGDLREPVVEVLPEGTGLHPELEVVVGEGLGRG